MSWRELKYKIFNEHALFWMFVLVYGGGLFIGWYFDGQTGYGAYERLYR